MAMNLRMRLWFWAQGLRARVEQVDGPNRSLRSYRPEPDRIAVSQRTIEKLLMVMAENNVLRQLNDLQAERIEALKKEIDRMK